MVSKTGRAALPGEFNRLDTRPAGVAKFIKMEKRQVHDVDVSLVALKIVTFLIDFRGEDVMEGHGEIAVVGNQRRFAGSHVGEDDSGALFDRIGFLTNRFAKTFSAVFFSRHVDDLAVHVVEPAMIDAAQAAVFESAVAQVRAAVRAVQIDAARAFPVHCETARALRRRV